MQPFPSELQSDAVSHKPLFLTCKNTKYVSKNIFVGYIFSIISNGSLDPKHTLFYYRANCLYLQQRRSGLRQVTKADKITTRK